MKKRLNVLMVLVMLVALLGSTSAAFAEGEDLGTWTTKADMPTARNNLGAASVNGKIYAIGGYGPKNVVEEYNPLTNTWVTKANLPTARDGLGVVALNGKIYAIGGRPEGEVSTDVVEMYDPETNTWTSKASLLNPSNALSAVELNGKIYAIGGRTVEEYNPVTDTWTQKTDMPTNRYSLGLAVANGKIYAIGGSSNDRAIVEEYDPTTDTWASKSSTSLPRYAAGAVGYNGKIYVVGGSDGSSTVTSKNVEVYDPVTDTWSMNAEIPTGRIRFAVAEVGGVIYAIGGQGPGMLHSVEAFTPPTTQQPPESPTNLTATAGDSEVALSWDSVIDATSYTVKRATTSGGPYTIIASDVTTTNYTDTDVTNGTTYYYVVTATVNGTETDNSNEASATTQDSSSGNTGDNAILLIKMVDGTQKEYDLTMTKVNDFIDWYEDKDNGSGNPYYTINKTWNQGPFDTRKDYIIFSKICYFEINEY